MTNQQRDNEILKLSRNMDRMITDFYGDSERGIDGIIARQQADDLAKHEFLSELRAIRVDMKTLHKDLLEKIAPIAIWKESIQSFFSLQTLKLSWKTILAGVLGLYGLAQALKYLYELIA